jgi:hypothetical protein
VAAVAVTRLDHRRRPITALSTDDKAPRIDQAQYEQDAGPCLAAYKERRIIRALGLQTAMDSRAQIEQAKGVLMASRHCTPEEAFQMMVQASQRNNEKLRVIAARIVTSQTAHMDASF